MFFKRQKPPPTPMAPTTTDHLLQDILRRVIRIESRLVGLAAAQGINVVTAYGQTPTHEKNVRNTLPTLYNQHAHPTGTGEHNDR